MLSVFVFYHYFPPDDVVSAVHFGDLCAELSVRGWKVTAFPCNRGCRNESHQYPPREEWKGVEINRIWRPRFKQSSTLGRLLNSFWMIVCWSLLAINQKNSPDVLVIGTDPIFSITVALIWSLVKPKTKIVHWCFDLYPEAAIAEGAIKLNGLVKNILTPILRRSYASCSLIVDIGSCMRDHLKKYNAKTRMATLVPWALEEPLTRVSVNDVERESVYHNAQLALMYSGSFGRAHSFENILELARQMRQDNLQVAFSVRGNRERELRQAISPDDYNVRFISFAPAEKLLARLAAADIHIVTLREQWTGTVVPSKFFGALAVGRPVLFYGSTQSSIAKWIEEYKVGWVISGEDLSSVISELRSLAKNPAKLEELFQHCHRIYVEHFSKSSVTGQWDDLLRSLFTIKLDQKIQSHLEKA